MGNPFFKAVITSIFIVIFYFVGIFAQVELPVVLLYPPVLLYIYFGFTKQKNNKPVVFLSLLPFFALLFFYAYINWLFKEDNAQLVKCYYIVYYSVTALILSSFSGYILLYRGKWQQPVDRIKVVLIQQLCILSIIISALIAVVLVSFLYEISFDVHPRFLIYLLMILGTFLNLRYVYYTLRLGHTTKLLPFASSSLDSVKESKLPKYLLEEYELRIKSCLEQNKLYLRNNISIELLSQESGVSRHHLSDFFNSYLHTSFYRFIAEYRIEYALKLLEQNSDALTMEGLAYECGFNSKTTFNKYFKEITGCSLSEYKNKIGKGK